MKIPRICHSPTGHVFRECLVIRDQILSPVGHGFSSVTGDQAPFASLFFRSPVMTNGTSRALFLVNIMDVSGRRFDFCGGHFDYAADALTNTHYNIHLVLTTESHYDITH